MNLEEIALYSRKYENTKIIGFMANFRYEQNKLPNLRHCHFDRMVPINEILEKQNIKLFVFSPIGVDLKSDKIVGYILEDKKLISVKISAPKIIGDWCLNIYIMLSALGCTMKEFMAWLERNQIQLYSSRAFGGFVSNKALVYDEIKKVKDVSQPQTEAFKANLVQLQSFQNKFPLVFIKPRNGSGSEKILVLKKIRKEVDDEGDDRQYYNNTTLYELTYYPEKFVTTNPKEINYYSSLNLLMEKIVSYVQDMPYLIQEGVQIQKFQENQPLDLRILIVNDGHKWNVLHVAYVGFEGVDISSRPEGTPEGHPTLTILNQIYGESRAKQVLDATIEKCLILTEHFSRLYPNQVPEMAYDVILDVNGNPYFLEVNTKPAIICPNHVVQSKIFEILESDQEVYNKYIFPYGRWLGSFLLQKFIELNEKNLQEIASNLKNS